MDERHERKRGRIFLRERGKTKRKRRGGEWSTKDKRGKVRRK